MSFYFPIPGFSRLEEKEGYINPIFVGFFLLPLPQVGFKGKKVGGVSEGFFFCFGVRDFVDRGVLHARIKKVGWGNEVKVVLGCGLSKYLNFV